MLNEMLRLTEPFFMIRENGGALMRVNPRIPRKGQSFRGSSSRPQGLGNREHEAASRARKGSESESPWLT